jgi:hypothetical protein
MKCHRAVALALVGWYLMTPPLSHSIRFEVDDQAPLREWTVMQAFDKASDCEDYRFRSQERHKRDAVSTPTNMHQTFAVGMMDSQCIETNDPRLAK